MCVKCQTDGELPAGRKVSDYLRYVFRIPLLHIDSIYLLMGSFTDYCKGGIFYEKAKETICGVSL